VLIIEDGSTINCEEVSLKYKEQLDITYYFKENSGQGFSRNYGYERAKGDYFIVFDSDCLIPEHYFTAVEEQLNSTYLDAFGGPDKAEKSFSITQKAINQSMTSVFTTGGIRGRKQHAGTYHPRSFNMGISRQVWEKTGGYNLPKKRRGY
jgi:glycosyltransferase involved in cell wall biosynthesis